MKSAPARTNMNDDEIGRMLSRTYEAFEGSEDLEAYMRRHGVDSLGILTVYDDETAGMVAEHLGQQIRDKVVVEIGAGLGLLACHLAGYARHVYAIEASPVWASCFAVALLKHKPKNCTYILGAASEMNGLLRADLALFCTHSGATAMREAGLLFAPRVVDVYAELLDLPEKSPAWEAVRQHSGRTQAGPQV